MKLPKFTISVLCHNRLELAKACIESIKLHSHDYELIVTDNGSTDGTSEYLERVSGIPGSLRLVTNPTNQGFKDPNNHALTLANGEFLVLLNNDMTVCEGWLDALTKPFEQDPKCAITGVAGTCQSINPQLIGSFGGPLEYIEGSCLMTPVALARKHGLFSHYLKFAYWEDADYSLRMREAGYNIATVKLLMLHDKRGSTSSMVPQVKQYQAENKEIMRRRFGWYFTRRTMQRRILVERAGAHGDVLLLTPALRALRDKYPLADIRVRTKCPAMLHGLEWLTVVDGTKQFPATWADERYVLDGSYEKRPEVHIAQAYADVLQVQLPKRWQIHMAASEANMAWAQRVARGNKVALIHAGPTCWPNKNWVLERFEEVVKALQAKDYMTVLVGLQDAPEIGTDVSVAGETTPQRLYGLAKLSNLFIGIDSMAQHVAAAADCPSVVLFGPTNPRAIVRPTHRIVAVAADQAKVPCVGEHGRRKKPITSTPCHGKCMEAITTEMVLKAVERVELLTQ
jgi:ADP-heptose:LPS heptosyltransferase